MKMSCTITGVVEMIAVMKKLGQLRKKSETIQS